jgi:hypothetical protein
VIELVENTWMVTADHNDLLVITCDVREKWRDASNGITASISQLDLSCPLVHLDIICQNRAIGDPDKNMLPTFEPSQMKTNSRGSCLKIGAKK